MCASDSESCARTTRKVSLTWIQHGKAFWIIRLRMLFQLLWKSHRMALPPWIVRNYLTHNGMRPHIPTQHAKPVLKTVLQSAYPVLFHSVACISCAYWHRVTAAARFQMWFCSFSNAMLSDFPCQMLHEESCCVQCFRLATQGIAPIAIIVCMCFRLYSGTDLSSACHKLYCNLPTLFCCVTCTNCKLCLCWRSNADLHELYLWDQALWLPKFALCVRRCMGSLAVSRRTWQPVRV